MTVAGAPAPPALDKLVRRCLEKDPDDRFQSARDVAFALDALSTGSVSESAAPLVRATPTRRWVQAGAALLVAAALVGLGFLGGRRASEKPPPSFKQLTFRRGWLDQARFAPDGRTVIYGAGWDGKPVELFQTRTDSPESRPLGLPHAKVLSISSQGQMAILLDPSRQRGYFNLGTLAVVPLTGGSPRELLEDVIAADWTPDGKDLCVSRLQPNAEVTIELPPGTILPGAPRATFRADMLRLSHDGRHVVFRDNGAGKMMIVDRERKVSRAVLDLNNKLWGLAWAPTSQEVWFTEGASMGARDVNAVDLAGRRRLVYRSAGILGLVDTAPDGRALLHRSLDRWGAMALLPGGRAEQDVTVNDNSFVGALSPDGRLLVLNGTSETEGWSTYLRQDGGDPIRVAAGWGVDISRDGRSILVITDTGGLSIVPIGPGLSRDIDLGALRVTDASRVPSPRGGIIVAGRERPEALSRLWQVDEDGSKPRSLEVGGILSLAVAPDGRHVEADLQVSRWSGDGRSLFLARLPAWPCEIHRLDLVTEKVELWKQVAPPDATGMLYCSGILPSADGRSYVYGTNRSLASLIVAEGLR